MDADRATSFAHVQNYYDFLGGLRPCLEDCKRQAQGLKQVKLILFPPSTPSKNSYRLFHFASLVAFLNLPFLPHPHLQTPGHLLFLVL